MQDFSTSESRHDFTVDGGRYYMPPLDFADIATLSEFGTMQGMEQAIAFREFISSRARAYSSPFWASLTRRKSAQAAVDSLSIVQSTRLFKEWIQSQGVGKFESLGESSGSPS